MGEQGQVHHKKLTESHRRRRRSSILPSPHAKRPCTPGTHTAYTKSREVPLEDTVRYCGSLEHSTMSLRAAWYSCRQEGLEDAAEHVCHWALQALELTSFRS